MDYMGVIWGLYRGYIGIMERKMETTILCLEFRVWGFMLGVLLRGGWR